MGEKKINFWKIIKGIKRQSIRMQRKTDCLLVRGDFNTFFSDSSITQYFWESFRRHGFFFFLKYGKCCFQQKKYVVNHDRAD